MNNVIKGMNSNSLPHVISKSNGFLSVDNKETFVRVKGSPTVGGLISCRVKLQPQLNTSELKINQLKTSQQLC